MPSFREALRCDTEVFHHLKKLVDRKGYPTTVGDECVIGHLAHLEGCIVEDGALVGSGAVVLHGAVVSSGALVGAAALVPGGMVVPGAAMALGVPAKVRPDAVTPEMIALGMQSYVERGPRYRDHLRRLD